MRDRLIELLKQNCHCKDEDCSKCSSNGICFSHREADYLLENGVIVPPCKVGDKVFFVYEMCDENGGEFLGIDNGEVVSFSMQKEALWMYCRYESGLTYWHTVKDYFGKTVFLTKTEAEQALSKLQASYEQVKEGAD